MGEGHSIKLGVWEGAMSLPAGPGQCPGGVFLKNVLNMDLKKMFKKLKIDTF